MSRVVSLESALSVASVGGNTNSVVSHCGVVSWDDLGVEDGVELGVRTGVHVFRRSDRLRLGVDLSSFRLDERCSGRWGLSGELSLVLLNNIGNN